MTHGHFLLWHMVIFVVAHVILVKQMADAMYIDAILHHGG